MQSVFVTGGAGYVGAVLIPKLLKDGYFVKVIDLMIYGENVFDEIDDRTNLQVIKGDIRDQSLLKKSLQEVDSVIHLACISNDPSFDLNPSLGKSINLDAFRPLVEISKKAGVQRFIYASSSSVFGVKNEEKVHENLPLEPLTEYSKFKAQCESTLKEYQDENFTTVTIRPATVCGYSPRQRLDVIVNILTNHAYHRRKIWIEGGTQHRPNVHIEDMCDLYVQLLELPKEKIAGKIYNFGEKNHTVQDLAHIVKEVIGSDVQMEVVPTKDPRSYRISSELIEKELGIKPRYSIRDAVADLKRAFELGKLPGSLEDKRYFNIKTMLAIHLQ